MFQISRVEIDLGGRKLVLESGKIADIVLWRPAFFGIAVIGALAMLSVRLSLPALAVEGKNDIRSELKVLARGPVLSAQRATPWSSASARSRAVDPAR